MEIKDVEHILAVKDNFARYKSYSSVLIKDNRLQSHPRVSVCIPTYKRVKTLKETIDSVLLQQGFEDFEVIVSDNNPERGDETEQYLMTLSDYRIKYYKSSRNLGMFGNLNRLIELTSTEYHVCIHDDDLLLPDFLKTVVAFLDSHKDIDVVYSQAKPWNQKQGIEKPQGMPFSKTFHYYKMSLWDCFWGCPSPPSGYAGRTNVLKRLGGYDEVAGVSSDYYFGVKAIVNVRTAKIVRPLWIYRWNVNCSLRKESIIESMKMDVPIQEWVSRKSLFFRMLHYPQWLFYSLVHGKILRQNYPNVKEEEYPAEIKRNLSVLDIVIARLFEMFWLFVSFLRIKTIRRSCNK